MKITNNYLNTAAYKFVALEPDELPDLRIRIKEKCQELGFRGTVLIAPEGINFMVAGVPANIADFKQWLADDNRFSQLEYKESVSDSLPFNRMLVRIKKEIIAFGCPDIQPRSLKAPYVSPQEFREWLDQRRNIVVLDTRNRYETLLGTFTGAQDLDIDHFRHFPQAVEQLDLEKNQTIVTFCTGGIRCEKASALLLKSGYKNVYQLQGGILKYFEECGDTHYSGECFVYDQRVALNSRLEETGTVQCFNCIHPVTVDEQKLESYVPEVSCPHCISGKWKP